MGFTPPPLTGDRIGCYLLKESLGVGGIAAVWRAETDDGKEVAIKVLHPGKLETEEVRRFTREFKAMQRLDHPNIVRVLEGGRHGPYPWLAMELVRGQDLGRVVDGWNADPPADRWAMAERILRELCSALACLHEQGFVHRDLKPSNILLTRDGHVKLTDFGGVKDTETMGTQLTASGRLVGTVAFMAPELITGDNVDSRQDLYSLGAVLYVVLVGRPPIEADSIAGYLARHLTHQPTPPSEVDPRVPRLLERICLRLLQKDPTRRPATARQVLAMLDGSEPVAAVPVHGRDELVAPVVRRCLDVSLGRGGVVVLQGPAGSGRSAVLAEVGRSLRDQGMDVVSGVPGPQPLLQQLLLQMPGDRTQRPGAGPAEELSARLAGRRIVLLVDDGDRLSHADSHALSDLVRERIAVHADAVVLVVTCHPDGVGHHGFLSGRDTGIAPDVRTLPPLDRAAVVAMLRDRGIVAGAAAVLGRRLQEALKGHPGDILEQVDALVRAGWFTPNPDGTFRLTRPIEALRDDPLPVPPRIEEQDRAMLARLRPSTRQVLDLLALIEGEVSPRLLAMVSGLGVEQVVREAEEMVAQGLLARRIEGVDGLYTVDRAALRQVVYGLLATDRRATLHRGVADAMVTLYRRHRQMAGVIAQHQLRGGRPAEAYPRFVQAAHEALTVGDTRSAELYLQQALSCRTAAEAQGEEAENALVAARLLSLHGTLLYRRGDLLSAEASFRDAASAARKASERTMLARALSGQGRALEMRGEIVEARGLMEEAVERMDAGDPAWADTAETLARLRLLLGDVPASLDLWTAAAQHASQVARREAEGRALEGQAWAELCAGQDGAALATLEQAEAVLRASRDREALWRVLLLQVRLAAACGRLREALDRAREAEQVARIAENEVGAAAARGHAAAAMQDLGQATAARTQAREALAMARGAMHALEASDLGEVRSNQPGAATGWGAFLAIGRVLLDHGLRDDVLTSFPSPLVEDRRQVEDLAAHLGVLRSRAMVGRSPDDAVRLVGWALGRPPSAFRASAARLEVDAAMALTEAGQPEQARRALARAVLRLRDSPYTGLRLEAGLLRVRLEPGDASRRGALRALDDLLATLPVADRAGVEARPEIVALVVARTVGS